MNSDGFLKAAQKRGLTLVMVVTALVLVGFRFAHLSSGSPLDPDLFSDVEPYVKAAPLKLDINAADSAQWVQLRGIGPVLSSRIIRFREMKGGFTEVGELGEVYGLSDSTYASILPFIFVDTLGSEYLALKEKARNGFFSSQYTDRFNFTHFNPKKKRTEKLELNSADSSDLRTVKGIGQVLSRRIVKYRDMIGGFDKEEDLLKVYGIKEGDNYEEILSQVFVDTNFKPVRINGYSKDSKENSEERKPLKWRENNGFSSRKDTDYVKKPSKYDAKPLDLNQADSLALQGIPGIGSKTAKRIVNFRNSLGFYHSVGQLNEVWGLSATNFQRMEPFLFVSEDLESLPHILINEWDVNRLKKHPYIDYKLANKIVNYRDQHGPYGKLDDLQKLYGVKPGAWEKLDPYIRY